MFTPEEKRAIIDGRLVEICSEKGLAASSEEQAGYLDKVFGEAFANAGNLFRRADLIAKLKSGYPGLLKISKWHVRNREKLSAEERKRDFLESMLDKHRLSLPDKAFDWRNLANQFRSVSSRGSPYISLKEIQDGYLSPLEGQDSDDDGWFTKIGRAARQPYEKLAERGAEALGYSDGSQGLEIWHAHLRLYGSHFDYKSSYERDKSKIIARGELELVCKASADYCEKLATGALPDNRMQSVTPKKTNGSGLSRTRHRKKRINEDTLAKIVSNQERIEAMISQMAQQNATAKSKRVPKSYPKDMMGLPDKQVSPYIASAHLTDLQFM